MYNWPYMFNLICDKYTGNELKEKYGARMEKFVSKLKIANPDLYDELMHDLYIMIYGEHFNKDLAIEAVSKLVNEDGSPAPHWSLEETKKIALQNNIDFDSFTEYDWYFVLNDLYSDYCKVFGQDTNSYIQLAKCWLYDKDAKPGKAYKYYLSIVK